MGSVKDLTIEKKATDKESGVGIFRFTDDYSVFDFGKMPDIIPGKGEALCRMSAYNFSELNKLGIKSHFLQLVSGNQMKVKLVRVLYPQKGELKKGMRNYLIPLELIFRNSLPDGSSVFKRLEKKETTIEQLGLTSMPKVGEKLAKPILDVSTKLEPTDRYLDWKEAQSLSCLDDRKMSELKQKVLRVNDFLNEKAGSIGLEHADGKVEFALGPENELMLVDVCGTLDEDRLLFNDFHISKQVLRDYYKTTPWYDKLSKAKESFPDDKTKWPAPAKLPRELIELVSNMYESICEAWTRQKIWNAPSIEETIDAYKAFLGK